MVTLACMSMLTLFESRYNLKGRYNIGNVVYAGIPWRIFCAKWENINVYILFCACSGVFPAPTKCWYNIVTRGGPRMGLKVGAHDKSWSISLAQIDTVVKLYIYLQWLIF